MMLFDVNVLVDAHRGDSPHHAAVRPWFEAQVNRPDPFGVSELVLSAFVRIVTHPRIFPQPTPLDVALEEADRLLARPNAVVIRPGPRHFALFAQLCRDVGARGNLVPDAYLAALAVESGCQWVSADRGFARFPGLDW